MPLTLTGETFRIKPTEILHYQFVVDGAVNPASTGGDFDTVTQRQDGTVLVEGVTGSDGSIDGWIVDGDILSWSADQPQSVYSLTVNGEAVTVTDINQTDDGSDEQPEEGGINLQKLAAAAGVGVFLLRFFGD